MQKPSIQGAKRLIYQDSFGALISQAEKQYGQSVVILIDEYDKPILDNIDRLEVSAQMRDGLKNLQCSRGRMRIYFVFATGVTKFSKVSLFSGLNQQKTLPLTNAMPPLCGYTQTNLISQIAGHLKGVDWLQLKEWYNGYQFLGEPVYNPFDILMFLSKQMTFRNYWFETGSRLSW